MKTALRYKTYLQFRRALRRYYENESPTYLRFVLCSRMANRRWRREYADFTADRTMLCSDACCMAMIS